MKPIQTIHQIFIVDGLKTPASLPESIDYNARSLRRFCPDASYRLWGGEELRAFIAAHFSSETLWAFDTLQPYSFKCDLARYCILSVLGGLYADLSIRMEEPLAIPDEAGLLAFRDLEFGSPVWHACAGGLIWAEPGRPECERAIEIVLGNCRARHYGRNALYPTGPVVWGRAILEAAAQTSRLEDAHDQWIGVMRPLFSQSASAIGFFTPDRRLVALRAKKIGADLTHLGASGVNNYAQIWSERRAYGETAREWRHDHPKIGVTARGARRADGIAFLGGPGEIVTHGPYTAIEPGSWVVEARFSQPVAIPAMALEAACGKGRTILRRQDFLASQTPVDRLTLSFDLAQSVEDVEFRTRIYGPFEALIVSLRLEPASR